MATVTDEIIDLHDRITGKLFNAAQNKHQQQFQASSMAINAKARLCGRIGQVLVDAKQSGRDPFAAIEAVMSWDAFVDQSFLGRAIHIFDVICRATLVCKRGGHH